MTQEFDMSAYLSTLRVMGRFHNVGLPDYDLPAMKAQDFAPNGSYIGASHIGNHPEMVAMLELASKLRAAPKLLLVSRRTRSATATHSPASTKHLASATKR
jgi:D-arabinose 1-dehydrogenase-like Zn-dependent alcohol dehydrogenase